jgi:hypothetical protein
MEHKDFTIGQEFLCGGKCWRCTDIGTRVIVAICLEDTEYVSHKDGEEVKRTLTREEAEAEGWFNGPPYSVQETVFDEDDMEGCEPVEETHANN